MAKKKILLKLTGEIFLSADKKTLTNEFVLPVVDQIKKLSSTHQFGIVIGGGNFFRGNEHGKALGVSASVGHQAGMLATMMNGSILKDLLNQHGLQASHFCAIPTPEIGKPISQQSITTALENGETLVFSGGTGNPFFTTDTNAMLRALQIGAQQVFKGTKIDGIYDADPHKNPHAKLLQKVSFDVAFKSKLGILDPTAYALAQQHGQRIRVFNIFEPSALIRATQEDNFGSTLE